MNDMEHDSTPLGPRLESELRELSEAGLEPRRDLWPEVEGSILASGAVRRSRAWLRAVAALVLLAVSTVGVWWYARDPSSTTHEMAHTDDALATIERITYDVRNHRVEIELRGAETLVLSSSDPKLTDSLVRLLEESRRPTQRLRALRALAAWPETHGSNREDLLQSLAKLLDEEPNPGLRLHAVRLLREMPETSGRNEILLLTLARDLNSAVRAEALDGLMGSALLGSDPQRIEAAVERTLDPYLRYKLRAWRTS